MFKDSDWDGIDDFEDNNPLNPLTQDEKTVIGFFETAELFEIYYLAKFCDYFNVTIIEGIRYINVYRQYDDYDVEGVQQGLKDIGLKCDIRSLKLYYGEYVNYKNGTSWAQIQSLGYVEWYMCFKWFWAEWMFGVSQQLIDNTNRVPKDVEENINFDFSVFDDSFNMEEYLKENQTKSTTNPSNVVFEPHGKPFENKTWGDKGEMQAAQQLALHGYDVEMLDKDTLGKNLGNGYGKASNTNPDCLIEGKVFDIYSPSTENLITIKKELFNKSRHQTGNIVLNLNNPELYLESGVMESSWDSIDNLIMLVKYQANNPLNELSELIILYNDYIIYAYVR